MVQALRSGEVKTNFAAARKFADQVPGATTEARQLRLYRKLNARRAELEAELGSEDGDDLDYERLARIGVDLSGKSQELIEANLTNRFRVAASAQAIAERVRENLRLEGLELSPIMEEKLGLILHFWAMYQLSSSDWSELRRIRKLRKTKELMATKDSDLSTSNEQKDPNSET